MKLKYTILSYFLLITLFMAGTTGLFAQEEEETETECVRTLARAHRFYDEGQIEKVEGMVRPCLNEGQLTKEEMLDGYKLIIMAKLYDDKKIEAEEAMLAFLKIEPEYKLQPGIDPKEFSEMFAKYHTSPLYTIGIYIGGNVSQINPSEEIGGYNTAEDKKVFTNRFGFHLGLKVSRYIYKGLNVNLEPGYMQAGIHYSHEILTSNTTSTQTKGSLNDAYETQSLFNIPLNFSYTFLREKTFRPMLLLGGGMRYMLSSEVTITKKYLDPSIASVETTTQDLKLERNRMTFFATVGAGIKWKIPKGEVFLDARYTIGFTEQVKKNAVDINDDGRLWNHYESDNAFKMDNMCISVGYSYYLFKPRKMKEKKVKDI